MNTQTVDIKKLGGAPAGMPEEFLHEDRQEARRKAVSASVKANATESVRQAAKDRLRRKILSKKPKQSRQQQAIELSLDVLAKNFSSMFSVMMAETAKRHDAGILDSLNLIEIAQDELGRMRSKGYETLDDCMADLTRIGAINNAISKACGNQDSSIGCYARNCATYVDVLIHVIEVAEDDLEVST